MKSKSGEKTLLMSVLMSSPGPIVVGIGMFMGQSATQIADFVRRTAELMSIIISFVIYKIIHKNEEFDIKKQRKLEYIANLCVGIAMIFSGVAMILIAMLSTETETGNVIPGLVIAFLGIVANSIFFFKYGSLNRKNPDAILAAQSRLYGAKALVDISVVTALIIVAIYPTTKLSLYVDKIGTVIVAVYLIFIGIITVKKGK